MSFCQSNTISLLKGQVLIFLQYLSNISLRGRRGEHLIDYSVSGVPVSMLILRCPELVGFLCFDLLQQINEAFVPH